MVTKQEARDAARRFDDLKAAQDVAFGVGKGLALLEHDGTRQLVMVLADKGLEPGKTSEERAVGEMGVSRLTLRESSSRARAAPPSSGHNVRRRQAALPYEDGRT